MPKVPFSALGLVVAILYTVIAILIVREDRRSTAGGWITLRGIGAYLITLPVSAVGEKLGLRPDYRRNVDMVVAIGVCALGTYMIAAGLGNLSLLAFRPMAP